MKNERKKLHLVEDIESWAGMDFESLTNRELRGMLNGISELWNRTGLCLGESPATDEEADAKDAIIAEHMILDGDYK